MILGITGLAQAGKDTIAKYLIENHDFERRAFADKLKEFCYLINPELREAVEAVGWENAKRIPTFRRFLQDVGHHARLTFGLYCWVDQILTTDETYSRNVVITDVRYPNEFDRIQWLGGWLIRVIRPGLEKVNDHITETQHLSLPVAFEVTNTSLDQLYLQVDQIIDKINEYE